MKKEKTDIKLREYKQPLFLYDLLEHGKYYSRCEIENQGWYEIDGYAITSRDVAMYKKMSQLLQQGKKIEPINSMYSAFLYKD